MRCTTCDPSQLEDAPASEGHIALRWGFEGGDHVVVTLDGFDVQHDVVEACPGPDGFVVAYVATDGSMPPHPRTAPLERRRQRCGDHIRTVVIRGDVVVLVGAVR